MHVEARLLPHLLRDRLGGRLADVGPAAGETPGVAPHLTNEQESLLLEHDAADVDLRRSIAALVRERGEQRLHVLPAGVRGHLGGDLLDRRVALPVVRPVGVGEPRLSERLQRPRPSDELAQASFSRTSWLTTEPSARPETRGMTSAITRPRWWIDVAPTSAITSSTISSSSSSES